MESLKYIGEANYMLRHHHLSEDRYIFYLLTILVIALSSLLHIGLYGAVIIIMGINLGAYIYFYKALQFVFPNKVLPLFACLLLLSFWPYQLWSVFLYTECLFYSMVLFLFARLILCNNINTPFLLQAGVLLLAVIISRPLGVLFIIPVLLFIFFRLPKRQRVYFYVALIAGVGVIAFSLQVIFTTTPDVTMLRIFQEENIICGIPASTTHTNLVLPANMNPLYQLLFYVTHNFSIFVQLAITRLRYFFFLVRDYYSTAHNAYLLSCVVLIYGLILVRIKRITTVLSRSLLAFIFSAVFLFAITIAFLCDDYHSRFFLTLMPLFVVLVVAGIGGIKRGEESGEGNSKIPAAISRSI